MNRTTKVPIILGLIAATGFISIVSLIPTPSSAQNVTGVQPTSSQAAGLSTLTTLQNAVSTTGNGSTFNCSGYSTVIFAITGTFTATVSFQGANSDGNFSSLNAVQLGTSTIGSSTTTTGLYVAHCSGLTQVRAVVTWTSGTSVTVKAQGSPNPWTSFVTVANQGGAWNVGLNAGTNSVGTVGLNTGTNSVGTVGLNAGTNTIGAVTGPTAAGSAPTTAPLLVAGSDGTNVQYLKTDTSGNQIVVGNIASAATDSGNPVKVGGVVSTGVPAFQVTGKRSDLWLNAAGAVVISTGTTPTSDGIGTSTTSMFDSAGAPRALAVVSMLHNGTTLDRSRANTDVSLLASAARAVTTASADQTNYNGKRLVLFVNITSIGTGSITPTIQYKDSISGNYFTVWTATAALVANGQAVYQFAEGESGGSFTEIKSFGLGARTWRLNVVANNANSVTYSVSGITGN